MNTPTSQIIIMAAQPRRCVWAFVAACALTAAHSVAAPEPRPSFVSSDGVKIAYDVRGSGDTTLVFVHCWACNRHFWRNQVDVFSSRYRVVTLDLAGHGESGKERHAWSILGLADDVVAVANALHLERMILIGHSMGGPVSLEAARKLKGRVAAVVLVDTMQDVSRATTAQAAQADAQQLTKDFKGYFRDLSAIFSKTSDPATRHWVEDQAMHAYPAAAIALKLDTPNLDTRGLFARAGVPIRAINAQPPLSEYTNFTENRKYADYDAILVSDTGHFIQLERPPEFNRALDRWLRELSARAPGSTP